MLKEKNSGDASEQEVSRRFRKIQVTALISFVFALVAIVITADGRVNIEAFAAHASGKPVRSVVLLLLLFGIKSLTIIVPLASLYIASGMLFSPVNAVIVSFLGLAVTLTVPYILGRWSGAEEIDYIKAKYPKIERIIEIQQKNEFFASLIVRLIGWFPCDIISYYFGACRTKYPVYIISALIGCAISVITNTLLGDVLLDPFSVQFVVIMLIKILVSAAAVAIAYLINRGD